MNSEPEVPTGTSRVDGDAWNQPLLFVGYVTSAESLYRDLTRGMAHRAYHDLLPGGSTAGVLGHMGEPIADMFIGSHVGEYKFFGGQVKYNSRLRTALQAALEVGSPGPRMWLLDDGMPVEMSEFDRLHSVASVVDRARVPALLMFGSATDAWKRWTHAGDDRPGSGPPAELQTMVRGPLPADDDDLADRRSGRFGGGGGRAGMSDPLKALHATAALRYLSDLAELRSIRTAAEANLTQVEIADAVRLSQPTVSRSLRRLRADPGLVARRPKEVVAEAVAGWVERSVMFEELSNMDLGSAPDDEDPYAEEILARPWAEVVEAWEAGWLTDGEYEQLAGF